MLRWNGNREPSFSFRTRLAAVVGAVRARHTARGREMSAAYVPFAWGRPRSGDRFRPAPIDLWCARDGAARRLPTSAIRKLIEDHYRPTKVRTSCLTSRTAHATPHCSLRLARVVASVPAQPLQVVRRRRPWCGAALFSLIGRAPPESTPPNARAKTRANAVPDTVKRDVPPPSLRPLAPRQPAVHSVPSTALAAPPSPDPPPEAPPEPPLRPLRLPVRSLPLSSPGRGDCGSTVSVSSGWM